MSSIRVLPDSLVLEKRLVDLVRPACIDYIFVIVHLVVNHENLPPKGRTRLFFGTLTCHNVASNRIRTVAVAIVGSCQVCRERGECRLEALAVILVITALATSKFGGSIAIVLIILSIASLIIGIIKVIGGISFRCRSKATRVGMVGI